MLKYTTAQVTFREIPDEVTLCINISNCPIHCPDCHSKELWEDIGTELTPEELERLIEANKGITCVCFMGGDSDYKALEALIGPIHEKYIVGNPNPKIKFALYSGRSSIQELCDLIEKDKCWLLDSCLDYIKVGPYIKWLGGLDSRTTNQHLYLVGMWASGLKYPIAKFSHWDKEGLDITYKFWKKD